MEQVKNKKQNKFLTVKLFILFFLLLVIISGSFLLIIYKIEVNNEKESLLAIEKNRLLVVVDNIRLLFQSISSDLSVIKSHAELRSYLDNNNELSLNNVALEYENFSNAKKVYDQVRYLDETGMEIIRINYINNKAYITPKNQLKNKSDRYYFKDTINLKNNLIFISPLDLNIEDGKIETPIKPIIRFSTPVFSSDNQKKGIVILNYSGKNLLDYIHDNYFKDQGELSIFNSDGYWLKSADSNQEWGFMYENKQSMTIAIQNPALWAMINSSLSGQVETSDGIYTYETVDPVNLASIDKDISNNNFSSDSITNNEYFWKIVSFTPHSKLTEKSDILLIYLLFVSALLIIFNAIISWILAHAISSKDKAEKNIKELNETLQVINKILRHDILGKLTGIKMNMELHRKYQDDKFLDYTDESVKAGINLIAQMKELEFAIINKGEMGKYDLLKMFKEIKKEYKITFRIIGKGTIKADLAIRSVFDNIIRNAILHGGTKKMTINIKNFRDKTEIRFVDYGKGIPNIIKDKLFAEGFKYGKSGGTGLGLYIVKKTIDRYGGTVSVVDNKPKGAVFVITLPK